MDNKVMYERDILFPTENKYEPGIIHVKILSPTKKGSMPVIIECKTDHSPILNINSIIQIMQGEIFDRINISVKDNISLYIKIPDCLKGEYPDEKYVFVVFNGTDMGYKGIDEIEY